MSVLVRHFGDIDLAEEAVQDAFTIAIARWPQSGVPPSPAGWIITTARNRAIDRLRRESSRDDRHAQALALQAPPEPAEDGLVDDDRLRLIFTCCHRRWQRLRGGAYAMALGGLTTADCARVPRARTDDGAAARAREGQIRDGGFRIACRKSRTFPGLRAVLAVVT